MGAADPDLLYYEDFPVGETVEFGGYEVTAEEIKEFGSEYDPLPFHTDEAAAAETDMGELIASGWHVCSMQMRMIYDGILYKTASMGSFGVTDLDTSNEVTIDNAGVAVAVTGTYSGTETPVDADLLAMFTPKSGTIINDKSTTGTIDWSFNAGSETFDYLADGETVILTYTLPLTDGIAFAVPPTVVPYWSSTLTPIRVVRCARSSIGLSARPAEAAAAEGSSVGGRPSGLAGRVSTRARSSCGSIGVQGVGDPRPSLPSETGAGSDARRLCACGTGSPDPAANCRNIDATSAAWLINSRSVA